LIASRASSTARERSPSLSISTMVCETPGEIVDVTRFTPSTEVSAASMRCVICVSISDRRGAGLRNDNGEAAEIDVRQLVDRQAAVRRPAGEQERQDEKDRRDRVADRAG
jgi:hypothetical protein